MSELSDAATPGQGPNTVTTNEGIPADERTFAPSAEFISRSAITDRSLYEQAERDLQGYRAEQAERIDWTPPWTQVVDDSRAPFYQWFVGGRLNVSVNCLDRHLLTRGDQVAYFWEGEPGDTESITFRDLHARVCRMANALRELGVRKGDPVAIYMGMVPELPVAMLACTRIGAPRTVVFAGFSRAVIADRINDLGCTTVITQDECWRHGRTVPLREAVDEALVTCPSVTNVIVTRRTATPINWVDGRDHWYHEIVANQSAECDPEPMDAEDPLFVLYTSGTTSKPKGILHEGAPGTPDKDRTWAIIERYGETILDTSPTAINTFMKWGVQYLQQHDLTSPRFGRRTDQARSLELVLHECWRWPLSHRRHMVADRDGHDHDRAAAQGHRAQRRLRHYPAARHSGKRHQ